MDPSCLPVFAELGAGLVRLVAPAELADRAERLARGELDEGERLRTENDLRLMARLPRAT